MNKTLPFKTFGTKENADYYDRKGAYVIPIKDNKICIVNTPKGFFLIGGGMDTDESEMDCIIRDCFEETGCNVIIKGKIASAETYCEHPKVKYFHPIQHYYIGELSNKIQEPIESDHILEWVDLEETKGKMFAPMQEWAIKIAYDRYAEQLNP
ncbi:MAG: NUDIX domain-containing protein [Eubacterium sp.]|nr:NUDIX domain-containing protein [Eubacterium sp.]